MKKVFWIAGGNMNKFHAFTEFSTRSICFDWLREGTISNAIKWNRIENKKNQKCKKCLKGLTT